jgi:hypothetical protein
MKTSNLIKVIPALLLGVLLTGNAQALSDKYTSYRSHDGNKKARIVKLNAEDISKIQQLFSLTDAIEVSWTRNELCFTTNNGREYSLPVFIEARQAPEVEDWMMESDYLSEEPGAPVEDWMTDDSYLDTEKLPLEAWMFDEDHFAEPEASAVVEPWMMDATYLSK